VADRCGRDFLRDGAQCDGVEYAGACAGGFGMAIGGIVYEGDRAGNDREVTATAGTER